MTVTNRFVGDLPMMSASEAIEHIPDDGVVVTSGFGSVGYPKAVPLALADDAGERSLTVITGGSVGGEIDTELVESGVMSRRFPYLGTQVARDAANEERIFFHDRNVSQLSDEVQSNQFGTVDIALVEAIAVGDSWIVPSQCIGETPGYIEAADALIVEINHTQPLSLQHVHDIYQPSPPPYRKPIPLTAPTERIGEEKIRFDPEKLIAVVETDRRDSTYEFREPTEEDKQIADNLGKFISAEATRNPTMSDSIRIQFGVGSLGNALTGALTDIDLGDRDLIYYGEVIQDGLLDLFDTGNLMGASATSLALTTEGQNRFVEGLERYAEDIVLRPVELSNGAELIERFGIIAVNSALEVDLFGHVNSTHVNGTHVINGIGGSGDFNRNALITVVALPSKVGGKDISRIVPMVPHVDHTEHDIDIVVTEQGIADLRGKSPRERATQILSVAHPIFQDDLRGYLDRGMDYGGHIPHDLQTALTWPRDRQQNM